MSKKVEIKVPDIRKMQDDIALSMERKYEALAIFADGQPFSRKRYIEGAKKALNQHVLAGVEAGKRLIVLHEMSEHGDFLKALGEIGIAKSSAYRYMNVARHFAGLDTETTEQLGMTRLYKMLSAPVEEIEKFVSGGSFLEMEKDDLLQLSGKELSERIKEVTDKIKFDLEQEKVAKEVLFEEKKQLEKKNKELQKKLSETKTGAPIDDPLPSWFGKYSDLAQYILDLGQALANDPPDLSDELTSKRCDQCMKRLENEMAYVRKYLFAGVVDPVEFKQRSREKLAEIDRSGKFDWSEVEVEASEQ